MCHSRLPTPETIFSLCAGISGNGGQVDRREKSYVFSKLYLGDFSLAPFGLSSGSKTDRVFLSVAWFIWGRPRGGGAGASLEMTGN